MTRQTENPICRSRAFSLVRLGLFGALVLTSSACGQPSGPLDADGDGYPAEADCDDRDPTVSPEAVDRCNDDIDQDCDGSISERCSVDDAEASAVSSESRTFGSSLAVPREGATDGGLIVGSPNAFWDDSGSWPNFGNLPGAVDVLVLDLSMDVPQPAVFSRRIVAEDLPGAGFGFSLAADDFDGDGSSDLMVGAPYAHGFEGAFPGGAFYFSAVLVGEDLSGASEATLEIWSGTSETDYLGLSMVTLGDLGGGVGSELAISSYSRVSIVDLEGQADVGVFDASLAETQVVPPETEYLPVANGGDLDGDGLADLVVGRPELQLCYVFLGSTLSSGGVLSLEDPDLGVFNMGTSGGRVFAGGQDMDGDGTDDLLVSSHPGDELAGVVGAVSGAELIRERGLAMEDAFLSLTGDEDFGDRLALVPDFDGDGLPDIFVGAPGAESPEGDAFSGRVFAFLSTRQDRTGTHSSYNAVSWVGSPGSFLGFSSTFADFSGDGLDDIVMGAPSEETGEAGRGAIHIIAGW